MLESKQNSNVVRVNTARVMFIVCTCIIVTIIGVNFGINHLEGSTIKLSPIISELEPLCHKCAKALEYEFTFDNTKKNDNHSTNTMSPLPPASYYGVMMWIDDEIIAETAHETINVINKLITAQTETFSNKTLLPLTNESTLVKTAEHNNDNNNDYKKYGKSKTQRERLLRRIIQWRPKTEFTSSDIDVIYMEEVSNFTNNVNNKDVMQTKSETNEETELVRSKSLQLQMLHAAKEEQVGLPTFEHVFTPDPNSQMHLITISIFTIHKDYNELDQKNSIDCFKFDDHQYICEWFKPTRHTQEEEEEELSSSSLLETSTTMAINSTYSNYTDKVIDIGSKNSSKENEKEELTSANVTSNHYNKEIQDALSTIIAEELGIKSFHRHDVAQWHQSRDCKSCQYASHALKTLEMSLRSHSNMIVPQSVQQTLVHVLQRNVHEAHLGLHHSFVAIAQLAHALQFHLLLTPQLFIPWDHAMVSQFTIIQPLIVIWLLSFRFVLNARKIAKEEEEEEEEHRKELLEPGEGSNANNNNNNTQTLSEADTGHLSSVKETNVA